MPKAAIINLSRKGMLELTPFKKLALFFNCIYTDQTPLYLAKWEIEQSQTLTNDQKRICLNEIEWLIEKEILKTYHLSREELFAVKFDEDLLNDIRATDNIVRGQVIPIETEQKNTEPGKPYLAGILKADNNLIFKMEDIRSRIDAAALAKKDPMTEFLPIVNSFNSYSELKTPQFAAHFILNKLPIPAASTSWEQLIDFRSDEEIKRKYYALINWVNEVSQKDMPIHYLSDQFNYLYSEYSKQYALHKLTTSLTTVELLITVGIGFVSSVLQNNLIDALKNLVTIRKQQVDLLKAEKEITGRELAYVFSVNEKFDS